MAFPLFPRYTRPGTSAASLKVNSRYTINGQPVYFEMSVFENLVYRAHPTINWTWSSLRHLRNAILKQKSGTVITQAIQKMEFVKRTVKYKEVIKYVIFTWPDVVPSAYLQYGDGVMPRTTPGHWSRQYDFWAEIEERKGMMDFVPPGRRDYWDLLYGFTRPRGEPVYNMNIDPRTGLLDRRLRICDDFNNASQIGTGKAFGRDHWGLDGAVVRIPGQVDAAFRTRDNLMAPNEWNDPKYDGARMLSDQVRNGSFERNFKTGASGLCAARSRTVI
jgi:hypothetical protein